MSAKELSTSATSSNEDNSWYDLSKSGYAKVIFSDLYHHLDISVGCKFQITDTVHEDPADFVGLFKVGYESLSQCLVYKLLSDTECEADGKLLRCTFTIEELPVLENGFYQFLYVTREKEVCGASMPFEIKQPKRVPIVEDIVADNGEDDFLVVRSNLAEENRNLLSQIDKVSYDGMIQEKQFTTCIKNLAKEKHHLEQQLKLVFKEREQLSAKCKKVEDEKNALCETHDETTKMMSSKIAALALKIEETYVTFKNLEKDNQILETDNCKIIQEKKELEDALNKLRKEFEVNESALKLLQKELRLKEESVDEDFASLASQLEDAKLMIAALEDSKVLVRNEVTQLTDSNNKLKRNQAQLRSQNLYLENKLKENDTLMEKLRRTEKEIRSQNQALEMKLKESETINEKLKQCEKELTCNIRALESQKKDHETSGEKPWKIEKELRCQILALELKLRDSEMMIEKMKKKNKNLKSEVAALRINCFEPHFSEPQNLQILSRSKVFSDSVNKVQFATEKKQFASKSITEESKILNTSCYQVEAEVAKCQCDKFQLELNEKVCMITKLKEECLKKDAVIEYLSKEKDNVQKNFSVMEDALNDSMLRLKEAADIYRKQYLEIEKLKKKLDKAKFGRKNRCLESSSNKDDLSSSAENGDETFAVNVTSSESRSSDSDTGEHVLGLTLEAQKNPVASASVASAAVASAPVASAPVASAPVAIESLQSSSSSEMMACNINPPEMTNGKFKDLFGQSLDLTYLAVASAVSRSSPKSRESPELQSMIDQNLANLSLSKSRDEEQFSIPCPICDVDIGIYASSSEEMIKHLEIQHKQQMCPVCGKLYDMTLHAKYFQFHVEDHFVKTNK